MVLDSLLHLVPHTAAHAHSHVEFPELCPVISALVHRRGDPQKLLQPGALELVGKKAPFPHPTLQIRSLRILMLNPEEIKNQVSAQTLHQN